MSRERMLRIHNKHYIQLSRYRTNSSGVVIDQPRNTGIKSLFNTNMYKPNRKVLALIITRPYLSLIVDLAIDYLESKFGKDRKNLFRLSFLLSGMYGLELTKTVLEQAIALFFGDMTEDGAIAEKNNVFSVLAQINFGQKMKFKLGSGVSLPFASHIFEEDWVKEYFANLIQQNDKNMFYIHLIDEMASLERYGVLDTTLSWAHCNEPSDTWMDRHQKFMKKYV